MDALTKVGLFITERSEACLIFLGSIIAMYPESFNLRYPYLRLDELRTCFSFQF